MFISLWILIPVVLLVFYERQQNIAFLKEQRDLIKHQDKEYTELQARYQALGDELNNAHRKIYELGSR